LIQKKTIVQIAKELGCVNSSVFVALNRFSIPRRNSKQAAKRGQEHHLWRGGNAWRGTTAYAEWRTMVFGRDNFTCRMCAARGVYLEAHHVLPAKDFPDLKLEVSNGATLCWPCHEKTFNREQDFVSGLTVKGGELLENPSDVKIESTQCKICNEFGKRIHGRVCHSCDYKKSIDWFLKRQERRKLTGYYREKDTHKNGYSRKEYHAIRHLKTKSGLFTYHKERVISNQADTGMCQKAQRLEAEPRTGSNASTSAVHESDDIVRSS